MFKWPSEQENKTNLATKPGLEDIKKFMVQAARKKSAHFAFAWSDDAEEKKHYLLTLQYVPKGFTFEWKLTLRLESKSESKERILWTRHSDDPEEIHLAIETSVDARDPSSLGFTIDEKESKLTKSQISEAKRIYEQTFDTMSMKDMQQMSLVPETLTGNLEILQITNLLQSISMGGMSGRLRIKRAAAYADIFFEEGKVVHAEGSRALGQECFIQVIGWKDGEFHFEPKLKTDEKTINKPMEALILEGCLLMDNTDFIKNAGVHLQAVLVRVNQALGESEFEQAMTTVDHNVEIELLKAVYLQVDSRKTIQD
ncbi:MAG: DUF4388 domain-containing protein, partial [Cyanobacteriota/Melainabacteria group bacterium]